MGLMGLLVAYYGGLLGILSGLTKSTDHPSIGTFSPPKVGNTCILGDLEHVLFLACVAISESHRFLRRLLAQDLPSLCDGFVWISEAAGMAVSIMGLHFLGILSMRALLFWGLSWGP